MSRTPITRISTLKVPLLDLSAQTKPLLPEIERAIAEVIASSTFILGPEVEKLESTLASYCGVKHALGLSSGTDALLVAFMALQIGTGDIVITTPYSFFASAGAIARLNAIPAMVEIDPRTYNMDPDALSSWFQKNPSKIKQVKAILPIHLFGQCADMDAILEIAALHNIPVIEDAAQALGATYPSKHGSCKAGSMGRIGCFSFFPSKNLGAMGDGGAVVTNDDALAETMRKLRVHGSKPKYVHGLVGGNFRLDALQAAILNVKFPHLESWHDARRKNAQYYDEALKGLNLTTPFIQWNSGNHIYNQYSISIPGKRDALRDFLNAHQIQTEVYYPIPLHLQECFRSLNYSTGDFPHSERLALQSLAIPIFPELTEEQQRYVVEKIKEFVTQ